MTSLDPYKSPNDKKSYYYTTLESGLLLVQYMLDTAAGSSLLTWTSFLALQSTSYIRIGMYYSLQYCQYWASNLFSSYHSRSRIFRRPTRGSGLGTFPGTHGVHGICQVSWGKWIWFFCKFAWGRMQCFYWRRVHNLSIRCYYKALQQSLRYLRQLLSHSLIQRRICSKGNTFDRKRV